ncbi:hypothetical protein L6452_05148 [Arctium lappa]|uniref:Uncharacterized protein n=1 Tax=Arctium lappa TaxID=4217 RepID=A0ACB9EFR7_ARCLA|nr:hypothetical protein L6452_05148 [Arctium lappa]
MDVIYQVLSHKETRLTLETWNFAASTSFLEVLMRSCTWRICRWIATLDGLLLLKLRAILKENCLLELKDSKSLLSSNSGN